MTPLLSLCIPTYNRAPLLRQALEAALSQATEAVEVVVSDNASTDETAAVLSEMAGRYPGVCLRAFCQPQNRGPDANIYQSVLLAEGEFCYILSDDDVLLPGAIAKLLLLRQTYPEADALALNIRTFALHPDEPGQPWMLVSEDTVLEDRSAALFLLRPLFLSVFAFRRLPALARAHADKAGTYLLQSYLFLDVLAGTPATVIASEPFLAQRKDNTDGWPYWSVMTTHYHALLDYARSLGFAESTLQAMRQRHLRQEMFAAIKHYKLTGRRGPLSPTPASYLDGIRRLLRVYGPNPFLLFVFIPLLLTPSGLLQALRRIYKRVRRTA